MKRFFRALFTWICYLRFVVRKHLLGFEFANLLIPRLDSKTVGYILRSQGASIHKSVVFESGCVFHNCKDYSGLSIGAGSHIGKGCFFDLKNTIEVGDRVTVSMQTTILTHQDAGESKLSSDYPKNSKPVKVEDDAYIGARATLLMGVTVSQGSVVAAGAVVNKNMEANTLFGGVPATQIKSLI